MHSSPFHILIRPRTPFQGRIVELIVIYMHFSDLFDLKLISPNPCEEETVKNLDLSFQIFRESGAFIVTMAFILPKSMAGRQWVVPIIGLPPACVAYSGL